MSLGEVIQARVVSAIWAAAKLARAVPADHGKTCSACNPVPMAKALAGQSLWSPLANFPLTRPIWTQIIRAKAVVYSTTP